MKAKLTNRLFAICIIAAILVCTGSLQVFAEGQIDVVDSGGIVTKAIISNSGHVFYGCYTGRYFFRFWDGNTSTEVGGSGIWDETAGQRACIDSSDRVAYTVDKYHILQDMKGNITNLLRPTDVGYYADMTISMNSNGAYIRTEWQSWDRVGNVRAYRGNPGNTIANEQLVYTNMAWDYDPENKPRPSYLSINGGGMIGMAGNYKDGGYPLGYWDSNGGTIDTKDTGKMGYNGKFRLLNSGQFVYDGAEIAKHNGDLMLGRDTVIMSGVVNYWIVGSGKGCWDASGSGKIAYIKDFDVYLYDNGKTTNITNGQYPYPVYVSVNDSGQIAFMTANSDPRYGYNGRGNLYRWSPSSPLKAKMVYNGQFASGNLAGWNVNGEGTAAIVPSPCPGCGGDWAAGLTTGSPVSISQPVMTPQGDFILRFNYQFTTVTGQLRIELDGQVIDTLDAPLTPMTTMESYMKTITDPLLSGQSGKELVFTLDGDAGSNILLAGIDIDSVPQISGKVDLVDFTAMAAAWLSIEGDANWNAGCDLALPDNIIDSADLFALAANWQSEIPQPIGKLDFTDFSALSAAWLSTEGTLKWNPICNLAQPNDVIDAADLFTFAANWLYAD